MKAIVDEGTCIGCALCVQISPEVFRIENGISHVIVDEVPAASEDDVREAADDCPVVAIDVEE